MSPLWIADTFTVAPGRVFYSLTARTPGETIPSPLLGVPGHPLTGFVHWWDPVLASAWFRAAKRQMVVVKEKFATIGQRPASFQEKMDSHVAMFECVRMLDYGYNALNIPWYIHRGARELYWSHMSGNPDPLKMFDYRYNSNGRPRGWFTQVFQQPLITDDSLGIIPKMIRKLYKSKQSGVRTNKFFLPIDVNNLVVNDWDDLSENDKNELLRKKVTNDWYYQPNIKNDMGRDPQGIVGFMQGITSGQPPDMESGPRQGPTFYPWNNLPFYSMAGDFREIA